ncbi:MAG TPA: hypothetical protein VLI55_15545 [Bryobacteraceae bacterium]|nr:hypothetical protein [Bryobacteraceae bacterium]
MMNRLIACVLWLTLFLSISIGQSQKNAPPRQQKQSSFTERLLKFLGISDSPGTLKSPSDEVVSGELWLADLNSQTTHAVTSGDGYQSPIFLTGANEVLSLRRGDVVRIPATGGEGRRLYSRNAILKLVAANSADSGTVLVLLRAEAEGRPGVGLLTISTGAITPVPYDANSSHDLQMIEDLAGWSRTYADKRIYVKRQSKPALSGTVEWSDVFLQAGNQPAANISRCAGVNCGQPSLSADGHSLVFIRSTAE